MFSDKTGTLTQNVMEFRKFSVGGISYGRGVTDIGRAVAEELNQEISNEDLVSDVHTITSRRRTGGGKGKYSAKSKYRTNAALCMQGTKGGYRA